MNRTPLRPVAFVLAATNHGTLILNRNDQRIGPDTAFGVGLQLLTTSSFDPGEINFALQLLEERRAAFGDGVVALDCGANIGIHTIEWARCMHGWGRVVAVEAQERIYYALAGNIALNNCGNASALLAAVGATCGKLRIPVPDYDRPASFGSLELKRRTNEDIGQAIDYGAQALVERDLLTIDSLALQRLDLVKLDIEGMEIEALEGARETLARCKPQLIVEALKSDESQLRAFLAGLGYRVFPLGISLLAVHESDPTAAKVFVTEVPAA